MQGVVMKIKVLVGGSGGKYLRGLLEVEGVLEEIE